jgi:two-component system, cell cycle response regulator
VPASATHAARAVPRPGLGLAFGAAALAGLLGWSWIARDGLTLDAQPLVVVVLLLSSAVAGRLVVRLGSRLEYVPSAPAILLAALVGGPLAGLAAGAVAGFAVGSGPRRKRVARAGLTAVAGFGAGLAGETPGSGPGHAIAVSLLAYGAFVGLALLGRLAMVAVHGPRPVAPTLQRATLADLLEALVLAPLLGSLVLASDHGGGPLVAAVAASIVAGVAVLLGFGRGREDELQAERSRARTDTLTGAPNRRAFEEALAKEHARVLRGASPAGLLLLDLDHFKSLNDRHGHEAGDDALVQVVGRLREHLRATDVVARWGGEEFVVLAPGVSDHGALEHYADRLRRMVGDRPFALRRTAVVLTTSIGATILDGSASPQQALERADRALYDAKRTRDSAVVALPLGSTWRRAS